MRMSGRNSYAVISPLYDRRNFLLWDRYKGKENLYPVPVPGTDQALKNVKFMNAFFHLASMQLVIPKCYTVHRFSPKTLRKPNHTWLYSLNIYSHIQIYIIAAQILLAQVPLK